MCWFHVTQAIKPQLEKIGDQSIQTNINLDIQRSQNEAKFNKAIELFSAKYIDKGSRVKEFLDYFNMEWVRKHPGWYEGFSEGPSTNNGLESLNGHIKEKKTLRKLMPIPDFIDFGFQLLREWSLNHDVSLQNSKPFEPSPPLTHIEYSAAYQFKQEKRVIKSKPEKQFIHFYFKSSEGIKRSGQLTNEQLSNHIKTQASLNFQTLDHFIVKNFDITTTSIPKPLTHESFIKSHCSCTRYLKKNICKHIIGICSMKSIYPDSIITIPMTAKNQPIGQKPKRGRPALAKKALERQNDLNRFADYESDPEPEPKRARKVIKPSASTKMPAVQRSSKRLANK